MYPWLRMLTGMWKAKNKPSLPINGIDESSFICMPWDLDPFLEMNNGRVLTLYDLGRFNLAIRIGLIKVIKENKWGLVVAGSTVMYRKRIRAFDRVTMRTQLAGSDDRWVYIQQSMWVKGQPCSSILLRTGVTRKGRVISTELVNHALGVENVEFAPNPWLDQWIASEKLRPWPPKDTSLAE